MARIDYDIIKTGFAGFVDIWRNKNTAKLAELIVENVACKISTSKHEDNDERTLHGISNWIKTYPKTDILQMSIYNYSCRLHQNQAQQIGYVICESLNYVDGSEVMDVFYYAIICADHWVKTKDGWRMDCIHMDVYPFYGNLKEYFEKTWYFGSKLALDEEPLRLPAIEGEYDSPWIAIPDVDAEDILSEEEKVKECIAKCFFGMDYFLVDHRLDAYSLYMNVNSKQFGKGENTRAGIAGLRYKRQKDRYWCHPFRFENIIFNEDKTWCKCDLYRVFGWAQRNHEYVWTRANMDIEHMCNDGFFEFVKEDGKWRMAYGTSALGIYELGTYSETLYGDKI